MINENPWLSIWVRPRTTIRSIVAQNPRKSLWILAYVYGFASLLNCFQSFPIALRLGMLPMLIVAVILAPFWGYTFFSIWSWIVVWVGKLFKGQGNFETIRSAYAWSCVPLIGNIPLWFLLITFYSDFLFFGVQDHVIQPGAVALLFLVLIGKLVFAIWSIIIFLQALAEVQQFSILRAIGNVVVASVVMGIVTILLWTMFIVMLNIR